MFFGIAIAAAQTGEMPAATATDSPIPTGRLTGIVLCNDTHLPARGALVLASLIPPADGRMPPHFEGQNAESPALVAEDGSYTIEHLVPGTYALFFINPGYLSGLSDTLDAGLKDTKGENPSPQSILSETRKTLLRQPKVTVRAEKTENLNVTLERGAVIAGQVHYVDGVPASQVSLYLESSKAQPPSTNEARMEENIASNIISQFTNQSAHPDDRGHFRLSGLRPDAVQMPDQMGGIMPGPNATRFYAGNTIHSDDATVFTLRPGEDVNDVDVELPLNLWHAVSGSVRSADGRIVQANVTLTDATDPHLSFSASTADDGSFRFPQVPAGAYTLKCDKGFISHMKPAPNQPNILIAIYTSAFAPATRSVLVVDADLTQLDFALKEIPLPAELKPENMHPVF